MFGRFIAQIRGLFTRHRAERELDEELAFHIEMETQANIERGMTPPEARRHALVNLGGVEQTRQSVRDVRRNLLDSTAQDLRDAWKRVRREPGVAGAAILTFGLTVGLATAVYSVAESILLRPFPFERSDRLLAVWKADADVDFFPLPVPEVLDLKSRARGIEDLGGFTREGFVLLGPHGARWTEAFVVTTNLFDVLGVRAIRGRTFVADDGQAGHDKVAVIGEALWRQAFAADPGIVGREVRLRAEGSTGADPPTYRIVGVVGPDLVLFYPTHLRAELYVPRVLTAQDRSAKARSVPSLITIARVRPGVPTREASADIASVMAASARGHPAVSLPGASARVLPLHEELVGRTRPAFLLLAAAALVLLLIGCANVANLLLASGLRRQQEFAARLAIGCSRPRLFRQLATEHLCLAVLGAAVGVALTALITPALRALAPQSLPRATEIRVHVTALVFAPGMALVAWLISGVAPAVLLVRSGRNGELARTGSTVTRRGRLLRRSLILGETALVTALLAAAALLTNGMWRLANVDVGFRARGVFVAQVIFPERWKAGQQTAQAEHDLLERLRRDPRIANVGIGSELPFTWGVLDGVKSGDSDKPIRALVAAIDDQYLPVLDVPLREGRMLARHEEGNRHVVVINEALKRRLPAGPTIGQRILIDGEWRKIVGVVAEVTEIGQLRAELIRQGGFGRLTLPAAYVPIGAMRYFSPFLLCRTEVDAAIAVDLIQKQVQAVDPEATIRRSGWLDDQVNNAGADIRFCTLIIGVFAVSALVLAAIGLYGILAHAVSERTTEIGIRTALGATPGRVTWTVAGDAVVPVLGGSLLGLGVAFATGRFLRVFLFEVAPTDPWMLGGATAILLATAALAAYFPARVASRLDPIRALRCEW